MTKEDGRQSPLPWRLEDNADGQRRLLAADGTVLATIHGHPRDAGLIVQAVNSYTTFGWALKHITESDYTERSGWTDADTVKCLKEIAQHAFCQGFTQHHRLTS